MAQTLLTFSLNTEKAAIIRKICEPLGIAQIDVQAKDCAQKLGHLAGIKGFPRERAAYTGAPFPSEMIVFSGMNSDRVDAFLDAYKKTGLPPIPLKVVVTSHNVFWTADALFRELLREHMSLR